MSAAASAGVTTSVRELARLRHQGRGFSFLPRQPIHSLLSGRHASRLRGRGLNFEEVRVYQPGDDIRSIDWKVTARTRTPHTRVFTEERDRPALTVVDQRRSMFFGSRVAMKSVVAAEAAALAAWRALGVGDRPGTVVFDDASMSEIRPHRSEKRVLEILHQLERFNRRLAEGPPGPSDPGQLNRVLERVARLAGHDALVVLVSDLDGADDDTRRWLTRLARHNDVLVAFVFDRLEAEMPAAGELVVGDGELQIDFDSRDPDLRARYAAAFGERMAEARRMLLQRQVPLMPIETGRPVVDQVRALLGHRPHGGAGRGR